LGRRWFCHPEEELTVFRRRRKADDPDLADSGELDDEFEETGEPDDDVVGEDGRDADDEAQAAAADAAGVRHGPWDVQDRPHDDDEIPRVDLGSLRIALVGNLDLRVEVEEQTHTPVSVMLVDGASQMQVSAFAAPKTSTLWAEVRLEIANTLKDSGGTAETVQGPFGPELRARIPEAGGAPSPARFLGVDGPRWFLRALIMGPAATDPSRGARFEAAFREVVVVRGHEAMAPRDVLPLHLPREAMEAQAEAEAETEASERRLELPERGPEITEIQ
jgi:hypothetical protein